MKTRIIHTRFWQDSFINTLNHKEKLLFIYLLTNDRVNITGIYELPDKYIKVDLDLTQAELDNCKNKFKGRIIFLNGWVKILNVDKYNNYNGEKLKKARDRELLEAPKELIQYQGGIDTSMNTSIYTSNNHKSKIINHKSKGKGYGENKKWLEKFNEILGANYKVLDDKTSKQIDKLIKEGFTLQDWASAITNASNDDFLMGGNDRGKKYLTPEYISRLDKFQMWLETKEDRVEHRKLSPIDILNGKTNYDTTKIIKRF